MDWGLVLRGAGRSCDVLGRGARLELMSVWLWLEVGKGTKLLAGEIVGGAG